MSEFSEKWITCWILAEAEVTITAFCFDFLQVTLDT